MNSQPEENPEGRKFYDNDVAQQSPLARETLERIGAHLERQINGKPSDLRRQVRQTEARSLVEALHRWFTATLQRVSRRSDSYLDDGRLAIDNNVAERRRRCERLRGTRPAIPWHVRQPSCSSHDADGFIHVRANSDRDGDNTSTNGKGQPKIS